VIFVDVPGAVGWPRHALDEYMLGVAGRALEEADAILFLVDVSQMPGPEDARIANLIDQHAPDKPVVLGLNKADLLKPEDVLPHTDGYRALVPHAQWMLVSATRGDNQKELLDLIVAALPEGPVLYPEEDITDAQVRELAAELVREAALNALRQEVPHGIAVEIEEFDESDPALARISATIYVEREAHKGIVIGKGGEMLKAIGASARREIEALIETQVFLRLHVKVRENWRKSAQDVRRLGYVD